MPKNQRSIVGDPIDIILGLIQEQVGWEPDLEGDDEDMMIKKTVMIKKAMMTKKAMS